MTSSYVSVPCHDLDHKSTPHAYVYDHDYGHDHMSKNHVYDDYDHDSNLHY